MEPVVPRPKQGPVSVSCEYLQHVVSSITHTVLLLVALTGKLSLAALRVCSLGP